MTLPVITHMRAIKNGELIKFTFTDGGEVVLLPLAPVSADKIVRQAERRLVALRQLASQLKS